MPLSQKTPINNTLTFQVDITEINMANPENRSLSVECKLDENQVKEPLQKISRAEIDNESFEEKFSTDCDYYVLNDNTFIVLDNIPSDLNELKGQELKTFQSQNNIYGLLSFRIFASYEASFTSKQIAKSTPIAIDWVKLQEERQIT